MTRSTDRRHDGVDANVPLVFTESEPLHPRTSAERVRAWRATDPARARAARTLYRRRNSKWETDASYLSRDFVAWDGEGITRDEDGTHRYVMLAVKCSNGESDYIGNPLGLGTFEIFEFVLSFARRVPAKSIHTIYGGSYDFNMWFRDIPREVVDKLYHEGTARWSGYRMAWRAGKSFSLSRLDGRGKPIKGTSMTIYDVVSFFQCPFVKACDSYLGDRFYRRDMVVENKALRSTFTVNDIPAVAEYNDAELVNLLELMSELRVRLNRVNLRPRRWDGPGAVASALMQREDVKEKKAETPADVARAARFAYAGGRFEVIRYGHYEGKVWEYDVNSAYPAALRNAPDLSRGTWNHVQGDPGQEQFALYHVRYRGVDASIPGALFRRDPNGTICYPMAVTGWYWSPEVDVAREYCERGNGSMEVIEAWVFHEDTSAQRPFHFIDALYQKRRALKAAGDGAHVGIKLALNSLYGKLAQQVGARYDRESKTWRIPPFHQLEWAGYTTSWCRAAVLRAVLDNLTDVIAFETDAVFVSAKLNVKCGDDLGEFGPITFNNLTYVQSGMYFGDSDEEGSVAKTRGVDRGSLTRAEVLDKMRERNAIDRKVEARLTRFVGAGIALSQSWERWRTWETMPKRLTLEPTGKRIHMNCWCMPQMMRDGGGLPDGLHNTECPMLNDAHSSEFPIMWINPDPNMSQLEEMRREVEDYE